MAAVKYLLCYAHSVYSVLYVPTPIRLFSLRACQHVLLILSPNNAITIPRYHSTATLYDDDLAITCYVVPHPHLSSSSRTA